MTIFLLDGTIEIEIFFECADHDLEDNICVKIFEKCPPAERLLRAGETNIFITPAQAQALGNALIQAAKHSLEPHPSEGKDSIDGS